MMVYKLYPNESLKTFIYHVLHEVLSTSQTGSLNLFFKIFASVLLFVMNALILSTTNLLLLSSKTASSSCLSNMPGLFLFQTFAMVLPSTWKALSPASAGLPPSHH